jgi:hypothetical protein
VTWGKLVGWSRNRAHAHRYRQPDLLFEKVMNCSRPGSRGARRTAAENCFPSLVEKGRLY